MTVCQELLNYKKIIIFARDFCSVFRGLYRSGGECGHRERKMIISDTNLIL